MREIRPKGWCLMQFGDAVRIANGQIDPKCEPYSSMIHIGPENIEQDTGRVVNTQTCRELRLISGKYEFDENAIVYSKIRPNLNKVCMPGFHGVCSADTYPIWSNDTQLLDQKYLLYYMLSPNFLKKSISASMRTGMPKINREDLGMISMNLPPIEEQRKIVRILSTWDAAIDRTQKLLENSRQQKKALMQQLLTRKRLLPGIKRKWSIKNIDDIATRITRESDGSEHPILTITSTGGYVTQESKYHRYMAGESINKYILLRNGEFAYNKGNSKTYQFGCIFPLQEFETGLVPHVYICFRLRENYNFLYYKYLFECDYLKNQLTRLVNTGVRNNGLLNIRPEEFMSVKVPVPSPEEQSIIGSIFHTYDSKLSCYRTMLENCKLQKKVIMQQLLTGKRRVKPDSEDYASE